MPAFSNFIELWCKKLLQADIPSQVGVRDEVDDTQDVDTQKKRQYYIERTYVNVPRPNMEIQTFMKDGMSKLLIELEISKISSSQLHVIGDMCMSNIIMQIVWSTRPSATSLWAQQFI